MEEDLKTGIAGLGKAIEDQQKIENARKEAIAETLSNPINDPSTDNKSETTGNKDADSSE